MTRWLNLLTNLFPVWVVLGGIIALIHPPAFTWFRGNAIVWGLAIIMLGMGMTLTFQDVKRVLKMPRAVGAGFAAQYCIMPLLGWGLAHLLRLETAYAVGLILVSCCPGGTASNVVVYMARADVALSVLMTTASTFGAVFMTPLLTSWLAGTYVPVDAWKLFLDTVQIVLIPVLLGIGLHHASPRLVHRVLPVAPLISVTGIILIVSSIVGQKAAQIMESAAILLLAVGLLHAGGFLLGYIFARLLGYPALVRRTMAVEVGMQNSGLGAALAQSNFPLLPLAPVPCAISAVCHSVMGSLLAGFWRLKTPQPGPVPQAEAARTVPA